MSPRTGERLSALERVVMIVGMPRSGTSWLGQIFDSSPAVRFRLSPLFAYAFKNVVDEESSREEWEKLFEEVYASDDRFMSQVDRRELGRYPVFEEKQARQPVLALKMTRFHNLLERVMELLPELCVVAIVRHPCGAIHSWLTTPTEFPAGADPRAEWRTGACRKTAPEEFWGFDDWKKVTRLHLALENRYPDRFFIQSYGALVDDAPGQTRRLYQRLDLAVTAQTERFLVTSQNRHDGDPHAVFKLPQVRYRWTSELDPEIRREIIRELRGTELERFLA